MSNIFVSGLLNVETSCSVRGFPIEYEPIDYEQTVSSVASGVGLNVALALTALGDKVTLASFAAADAAGDVIRAAVKPLGEARLAPCPESPQSVVLYDGSGTRRIYTDLKDMQTRKLPEDIASDFGSFDAFCLCNINFSRELLPIAKQTGKPIFTDVHCLDRLDNEYNADFMRYADVLFLSNEYIKDREESFIRMLSAAYPCDVIVIGMGGKGALLYNRGAGRVTQFPSVYTREVVNTVGAGDALFSAFVHFYTGGCTAEEALKRATVFASYKIGESGASKGFLNEAGLLALI